MLTSRRGEVGRERGGLGWILSIAVILGISLALAGTLVLKKLFPGWRWLSLPLHSTLEVGGTALGFVLAPIIILSKQKALTAPRMWIACALVSIAVLDIFHSSVLAGNRFVWLHSLAVLAGGILFALRVGYQPEDFNDEYVLKVHGKRAYTCHQQQSTNQIRA